MAKAKQRCSQIPQMCKKSIILQGPFLVCPAPDDLLPQTVSFLIHVALQRKNSSALRAESQVTLVEKREQQYNMGCGKGNLLQKCSLTMAIRPLSFLGSGKSSDPEC